MLIYQSSVLSLLQSFLGLGSSCRLLHTWNVHDMIRIHRLSMDLVVILNGYEETSEFACSTPQIGSSKLG